MVRCRAETSPAEAKAASRLTAITESSGLGSHWRADGRPKAAYASQGDALTAALMRRQDSGVALTVYRCDVCSAWHMGNPRRGPS